MCHSAVGLKSPCCSANQTKLSPPKPLPWPLSSLIHPETGKGTQNSQRGTFPNGTRSPDLLSLAFLTHPMDGAAEPWPDLPEGSVFEGPDVLSLLALPSQISETKQVPFYFDRLKGLFQL